LPIADIDWPPHAVTVRVLDDDGREVHSAGPAHCSARLFEIRPKPEDEATEELLGYASAVRCEDILSRGIFVLLVLTAAYVASEIPLRDRC
jgi:hypothetical protein